MVNKKGQEGYALIIIIILIIVGVYFFSISQNESTEETSSSSISSKLVSRYYYDQLDSGYKKYGKFIYDELYKNKENLKSGNYEIKLGNQFIQVLSSNYTEGSKYLYTSFVYAKAAFIAENPDVFFLDESKMDLDIKAIDNIRINCGNNENYYRDGFTSVSDVENMEEQIQNSIRSILAELNNLNDDYSKIKRVHDYLCETITYDANASHERDIYGALVEKKCVCDGYSRAFQYFMNILNIESVRLVGTGYGGVVSIDQNHAWNYVKLNDNWYAIDVTWDDVEDGISYDYFLRGKITMDEDHINHWQVIGRWGDVLNKYVEEEFSYPTLSSTDYE